MFKTDSQGIWTVIHPVGDLDVAVADEFRATILEAMDPDGTDHLAIDFSEVTFLDSSGIGVIATILKLTRVQGGRLVLVGLSEQARRALEITGIAKLLDIGDALPDDEFAVEWMIAQPDLPTAS
jgi:anti-anti-sigma factor